jgi:1-phosphofructokinase
MSEPGGRIAVFAPSPLLSVTIELRGSDRDDVHCHPAGQGVWLSRMAGELGAWPVLCSLVGGETGALLEPLLERLPGERRLVRSESASGSYVTDRRSGERRVIAQAIAEPASRHEADELVAATTAAALECDVLAICNPYPADAVPLEVYGNLVANAPGRGRDRRPLEPTNRGRRPGRGGAGQAERLGARGLRERPGRYAGAVPRAAERLRALGAANVLVTRAGDPPSPCWARTHGRSCRRSSTWARARVAATR